MFLLYQKDLFQHIFALVLGGSITRQGGGEGEGVNVYKNDPRGFLKALAYSFC